MDQVLIGPVMTTKPLASGGAEVVVAPGERGVDESAEALLTLASAASPDGKPMPAPGEAVPCPVCKKEFPKLSDMKRHKRGHTGERSFNCLTCQKAFLKASDLKRHTRIHTGERPYRCSVCGRAFAEGGSLQRHTRMHTGERPYACSVCDKRFVRSYNAKKHMKMHKDCIPEIINLGKPAKAAKRTAVASLAASEAEAAREGDVLQGMIPEMKLDAFTIAKQHNMASKSDSSPWLYQSVSTPPASNSPKRSPPASPSQQSAFATVMSPMSIPAPMVSAELLASGITARILQH